MAQRNYVTHPIVLRRLRVARVSELNPRMRRVTLVGEQLAAFERDDLALGEFVSSGFDDHVKLIFAADGDIEAALPVQRAQTIDWPEAPTRQLRDYTPRRFDPARGELDLDFVRHGDGPAASWAETVAVGDELHIAGPKSSLVLPEGIDWVLLAGDETALPAIGRFLDERTQPAPAHIVVELRHPEARQPLNLAPGDTLRWVENPSGDAAALAEAVRELDWPAGTVYAWAAAASGALLPLRRWLSRERRVPKTHMNVTGYWHAVPGRTNEVRAGAGHADAEHADAEQAGGGHADSETPPESVAVDPAVLLSPVPWFATRAAIQSGLLDAVADRPDTVAALAERCGLAPAATATLIDYLVSIQVCALRVPAPAASTGRAALVALGPVGSAVLGDEHLRAGLDDSLEAAALLALAELAPALRGGPSAWERSTGHSLLEELNGDPARFEEQLDEAIGFDFIAGALHGIGVVSAASTVAVSGVGSIAVADALRAAHSVRIVESVVGAQAVRASLGSIPAEVSTEWRPADLAIAALALSYRSDAETVDHLGALSAAADVAIVIELLEGEGLGPPDIAEHRLIDVAASGHAVRDAADIERLAEAAGWRLDEQVSLGWNYEAFVLRR